MIFKDREITEKEHLFIGIFTALASIVLAVSAAFGNLTGSTTWTCIGILIALLGGLSLLDHLKRLTNSKTGTFLAVIVFMLLVVATNFLSLRSN